MVRFVCFSGPCLFVRVSDPVNPVSHLDPRFSISFLSPLLA